MEPAAGGVLYAAQNLVQGALAAAKGIVHPTLPLKATFSQISGAPIPRASHSVSVVKGRAYVFGGELADGRLADNGMHVVILPSSGVLEADYYNINAKAGEEDGGIPPARKGHSAVVVGDDIFVFGGDVEGSLEENGRVWVFSTSRSTWSSLDPTNTEAPVPASRSLHAAASTEDPAPKESKADPAMLPQQPPDPAKNVPEPPEPGSWGTVFISSGKAQDGEILHDLWAFDIRSRTWTSLAPPPGPSRLGASMVSVGPRLYLFGGSNGTSPIPSGISHLDVSGLWKFSESGGRPARTLSGEWETLQHGEGKEPTARSGATLIKVTTGQGRNYLLLVGGSKDSSTLTSPSVEAETEGESSPYLDDVWAFQLPSAAATAASAKDATRNTIKMDTKEANWSEIEYQYINEAGDVTKERPTALSGKQGIGARVAFAAAKGTEVDGASVVIFGGANLTGQVLDDGWMITVDR